MNNILHEEHAILTGDDVFEFLPESHLVGLHTQFIDDLTEFNSEYNTDLQVKKTFHWKNGTYDKIRAKTVECVLPFLNNKPRGSHNIIQVQQHRYNNFKTSLLRLEHVMADKRWHRYAMGDESDDGYEKWQAWLDAFMRGIENFNTELMEIPIIGTNFFGRRYRRNQYDSVTSNTPWHEISDTKPYIMFQFNIPDFKLHIFSQDILLASIPWGGLTVYLEMDLYWWVNTMGNTAARDRMAGRWTNMQVFTPYVTQEPIYTGLQHPYIKTNMDRYSGGNACFGNYGKEIAKHFHSFQWKHLYSTLIQWASTYHLGTTSPLNQYWACTIGKKLEYVNMHPKNNDLNAQRIHAFKDNFSPRPDTCDIVFRQHYASDKIAFVDDHCNQCLLSGVIEDSQGGCDKYLNQYAPDAFHYEDEVLSMLVFGFGIDTDKLYHGNGDGSNIGSGPNYFGINIRALGRRLENHYNGDTPFDDGLAQEQLFAVQMQKAELINELGEVSNWTRRRTEYNRYSAPQRYLKWYNTHRDYSADFLTILKNKQKRLNERDL